MSTRKTHLVLLPKGDGSVEMHAMKEWLRQHPGHLPEDMNPTGSTSQQLRGALKRRGWTIQETDTEFRLLPPDTIVQAGTVLNDILEEPDNGDESEDQAPSFELEYQLRDFLCSNLSAIPVNGRRLRVYVDPTGRDGVEYRTSVGPIDLLAIDDNGEFHVFELKRGRTPDHVMGQLTRYMGWVSQTIGAGKATHGIIVAKQVSDTLRYAACVVPNVSLFEYEVSFQLHPASALP